MNSTYPPRWSIVAVALLALCGAYVSGALLAHQGGGWESPSLGTGFLLKLCDPPGVSSTLCSGVIDGQWGGFDVYFQGKRLFFPTSFFGVAYFLVLAIWFPAVVATHLADRRVRLLTLAWLAGGLMISIALVAHMAFVIKQWCALCMLAHAFNLAIGGVMLIMISRQNRWKTDDEALMAPSASPPPALNPRMCALTGMLMLAAVFGVWGYFHAMSEAQRQWRKARGYAGAIADLQSDTGTMLREFYAQPVVDVPALEDADSREPAIRVTIFTDYDDGGAACFDNRWRAHYAESFGPHAIVEYRHRPAKKLASDLALSSSDGSWPIFPAVAAEAARLQGGPGAFQAMHELLFLARKDGPDRNYASLAHGIGLDAQRFLQDLDALSVWERVEADAALASALQVNDAPTIFLNGRRVPDICVQSPAFWEAVALDLRMALEQETANRDHLAHGEPLDSESRPQ